MAKSLIEHVNDYNDVIERKIARLEARAVVLEGEIEKLEAGYEEEINDLEAGYEEKAPSELDRGGLDEAVAKRCESEKKQKMLGKVNGDIENTDLFDTKGVPLTDHNNALLKLREEGMGGARKAWGGWVTSVAEEPDGRMSTDLRDSIRAKEKARRERGEKPIDLRKELGGNKRRVPQQTFPGKVGKVFTHKEIRALNAGARQELAEALVEFEYPPKIIYDVTGLSRFMQEKLRGERRTLSTQG